MASTSERWAVVCAAIVVLTLGSATTMSSAPGNNNRTPQSWDPEHSALLHAIEGEQAVTNAIQNERIVRLETQAAALTVRVDNVETRLFHIGSGLLIGVTLSLFSAIIGAVFAYKSASGVRRMEEPQAWDGAERRRPRGRE